MKSRVVQITEAQRQSLDQAVEAIVRYDSRHEGQQYEIESILADGFFADGNSINVTIMTVPTADEIAKIPEAMREAYKVRCRHRRWFSIGARGGYRDGYRSKSLFHVLRDYE